MKKLVLSLIVGLALVLRLYQLGSIPVSLYWDEVSIGYNAYAIGETGKDEYGTAFPLIFRAFDDYKLPGQVYLTVPFIKVFGLTEQAVRLPAVIIGALTVLVTYFLIKGLLPKKEKLALLTALLLAISPWHLLFTRASFEAGSGLFFIVLGATLILTKKKGAIFLGAIVFALSAYFYRSAQIVAPLLLVGLVVFTKKFKLGLAALTLFIVLSGPIVYQTFIGVGNTRINQVGVANETFDQTVESARLIEESGNTPLARIIYNRRLVYAGQFVKNYVSHLDPYYLFIHGDPFARHRTAGVGILFYWEIVAIPLGIWALKKKAVLPLYWWIIALIPAALAMPTPHALRSLNALPIPQLLSAAGVIFLVKKTKLVGQIVACLLVTVCCYYVLQQYFVASPGRYSFAWGHPYKELVQIISTKQQMEKYDKVVVTGYNWQPYIYFAFYEKWNPQEFQQNGNGYEFRNYWFAFPNWDPINVTRQLRNVDLSTFSKNGENVLYVLSEEEVSSKGLNPNDFEVLRAQNGQAVFYISR